MMAPPRRASGSPRRHAIALAAAVTLCGLGAPAHALAAAPNCAALAHVALPGMTVTAVETVAAAAYKVPGDRPEPSGMNLAGRFAPAPNPAFCRFAATLRPSSDSDIRMEVWLPLQGWNGKFLGVANFGWGGSPMYGGMLAGLQAGYAVASNDTGHQSASPMDGGSFALGHPQKLIDYSYRAYHLMTVDAKSVIKAFYGGGPKLSYIIGCSLGGLEALIEAKRYPADYDGVVAGAPPNPLTRFNAAQLWPGWLIAQDKARTLPREKLPLIRTAVLKACATPLEMKDGALNRPDRCGFDPASLLCKGGDAPDCLTAPQIFLVRQTYAGPRNPRTGALLFPGPAKGSEGEWVPFTGGVPFTNALDLFRYAAFQDANWNWAGFDYDRQLTDAESRIGALVNVDADLTPFFRRGGKLLLYIGWNDFHNPNELADYYQRLIAKAGPQSRRSVKLFAIPGMNHCAGGAGCDTFNKLGTIDSWVANGAVPHRILAAKVENGRAVRTRPLCEWPLVARYKGAGDTNDAANFTCGTIDKGPEA